MKDDNLVLLHKAKEDIHMAVNTPQWLDKEADIKEHCTARGYLGQYPGLSTGRFDLKRMYGS